MSMDSRLDVLKKSTASEPNSEAKKTPPSHKSTRTSVVIFIVAATVIHGLTLPIVLNLMRLTANEIESIDVVSSAILQVMAYTGQMFAPFFTMLNQNYLGETQAFANIFGYVIAVLFVLQVVAGCALFLRSKRAWMYLAGLHLVLIFSTIWQIFQPGFMPHNWGMVVWPSFMFAMLFEGSVLRYVGLQRTWKLLGLVAASACVFAAVVFGGSIAASLIL